MKEPLSLKIYGRVDLDGTHRGIIILPREQDNPFDLNSNTPPIISLSTNDHSCACLVNEVSSGSPPGVYVDRFKMWQLGARDGDTVEFAVINPPTAESLKLLVPRDYTKRDAIRFIGKPLAPDEITALFTFSGDARRFTVAETQPPGIVLVGPNTAIEIIESEPKDVPITYQDIGGLDREVKLIREVVEYPLKAPEMFTHLGVTPPKGIILHGPPGTGKTLIARALAGEVGANFYSISGPEIYSKWYGKSEENLRNIFEGAVRNAPSIVVIDELDSLAPIRESTHGDQEQRIVATFLTQMDGLQKMSNVVVVGTTNRINAIDPALRRSGRFEYEVHIGVPDARGRQQVLEIHTRGMPLADDIDLQSIALKANGLAGADLGFLCREAAYNALRRTNPSEQFSEMTPQSLTSLRIEQGDFLEAIKVTPPSGIKEFHVEIPEVRWADIGGLEDAKQFLNENISYAITRKDAFRKAGVKPASGILLHGPPGTGKTMLARAVATECGANFIATKGSLIRSKKFGEAEEHIHLLFSRARQTAPCVVFFDEIDSAIPTRGSQAAVHMDGIVNQILSEMDGIEEMEDVFVIGATNRLELMDPAALRPGRFDMQLEIGLPTSLSRASILEVHLKGKTLDDSVSVEALIEKTSDAAGAEIAEICRLAAWNALKQADFDADKVSISMDHFEQAIASLFQQRTQTKR